MIAKIYGIIDLIGDDYIIVNVNGIGYLIFVSYKTISLLPKKGNSISLIIHTYFHQDNIQLYGFINNEEKIWFCILINIQGVGKRLALIILSYMTTQDLLHLFDTNNISTLCDIPGIGKKLSTRIVRALQDQSKTIYSKLDLKQSSLSNFTNIYFQDAVSALVNLGYGKLEASFAVRKVIRNKNNSLQNIIKLGLKELMK